jgi:O-antigen/teichoic acid export membrane protein
MQSVSWTWVASISGLFTRVLAPFGYFPRVTWWGFVYSVITAFAPLVAVVLGGDLLQAGIAFVLGAFAYSIPLYIDLFRLMKKEGIPVMKPSWRIAFSNFSRSLALFAKSLFENIRQQGARLVLAPVAGAAGLAAFSTMRTGANVALQGLNTVTNPLMPDLVRFLNERDQPRSEAAFSTVWIVVIGLMAPGVVVLQTFVEPFYTMWTRGKIPFDPPLFAVLSLGVLIYAAAQPSLAVVVGHNMLRPQLVLSALAAILVITGIATLVPIIGILGAGVALLCSEIAVATIYLFHAKKWLRDNDLKWPAKAFAKALTAVAIAAVAMACMIIFPSYRLVVLFATLILMGWNLYRYWRILPEVAINQAHRLVNKIPVLRTLFTY